MLALLLRPSSFRVMNYGQTCRMKTQQKFVFYFSAVFTRSLFTVELINHQNNLSLCAVGTF